MSFTPASAALSRFTVLDLTRVRSGPTCVRQLADWGANVIKIELPDRGGGEGEPGGPRGDGDFQNLHRNKRSLTIDLKHPQGVALLKRMAARADVVVENYRPGVAARLGIDYDALAAVNPRLVYAAISGFGADGPYHQRPGFDQIAQGMGGLMSITGLKGQGPVRAGIPVADLTAGLLAATGILVALLAREATGRGQKVETSLLQAQIFMLDFQAARFLIDHDAPGQAGNDHPTSIPTGVFPTSDGHVNIAAAGQPIWERLARALGAPEWIADPEFVNNAARSKHRARLNALIGARTKDFASEALVDTLNKAGVPSGPIYTIDRMFEDPQVRHLGVTARTHSALRGEIEVLAQAVRLSDTPSAIVRGPPDRGEHSEEILLEFGLGADEIAALRAIGAI
jgi:crotonobetainyl-CoA:carnitine CoA-transferase CaiB-like acyl-CoA transferase